MLGFVDVFCKWVSPVCLVISFKAGKAWSVDDTCTGGWSKMLRTLCQSGEQIIIVARFGEFPAVEMAQ